jgi:hypothetical protein
MIIMSVMTWIMAEGASAILASNHIQPHPEVR